MQGDLEQRALSPAEAVIATGVRREVMATTLVAAMMSGPAGAWLLR